MSFTLKPFQDEAVAKLRDAAIDWAEAVGLYGPPRAVRTPIPLLASLIAITGGGKTPILASVLGGLGPSIVFWTTKSAFLAGQTVEKLRTTYRHFLPPGAVILDEIPSAADWQALLSDVGGTAVWVRTVASWNAPADAARNTDEARLNLHRPAPDWAGDASPWGQLADRSRRSRPLWVVYDEGHGQTAVQLDQLLELNPAGIFAATATPITTDRLASLRRTVSEDAAVFGPIMAKAQVRVSTADVAAEGLLKTVIRVSDFDVEELSDRIRTVSSQATSLEALARDLNLPIRPRAVYIVEKSDLRRGEKGDPPPIAIWRALTDGAGIPADQIAIATDTKELPQGAERVDGFSALVPRHRHVIFNKKLQEGWDDPEAYVAYFDGVTNSAVRISQLIGRVIRQPAASAAPTRLLNTAYLFVNSPNDRFDRIVRDLQRSLLDTYESDEDGLPTIAVETNRTAPTPVPVRAGVPPFALPRWVLTGANLTDLFTSLRTEGDREFGQDALDRPGVARTQAFDLTAEDRRIVEEAATIGSNLRTENRDFFFERVGTLSRAARLALNPVTVLVGPMWNQRASVGSQAQVRLAALAREYVDAYETRVRYVTDPNPDVVPWTPGPYSPKTTERVGFTRSLHVEYPNIRSVFNPDELEFARALDKVVDGWWARNFATSAQNGYGLQLPASVAGSNAFYPDFLWWVDDQCWAIDTTGRHLLDAKIRGKLLALADPKIALVTRGRLGPTWQRLEDETGWTLVRPSNVGEPRPDQFERLEDLLVQLRAG
jgi:type III restriction enzyme